MMTEDRPGSYPSQMKNTLKLHADPTHLVHLSRSLSSTALKKQPAHMKIVQVIKVWRGSSPSHPQSGDSVQTDIELCEDVTAGWKASGDRMKRK